MYRNKRAWYIQYLQNKMKGCSYTSDPNTRIYIFFYSKKKRQVRLFQSNSVCTQLCPSFCLFVLSVQPFNQVERRLLVEDDIPLIDKLRTQNLIQAILLLLYLSPNLPKPGPLFCYSFQYLRTLTYFIFPICRISYFQEFEYPVL